MDTLDDALRVIRSFNEAGVEYVVVGGVAVNMHGLVRATEDLDVFVRPDVPNIAKVRVATPRTLYRMKKGTVRPIDHNDAAALRQAFHLDED